MLNEESTASIRLEDKGLREEVGRFVVKFKLSHDVNEDATVQHGLTVGGRDDVLDTLDGQGSDLLHNLGGTQHLITLVGHERLLRVQSLKLCPLCVERLVVQGREGLPNPIRVDALQ